MVPALLLPTGCSSLRRILLFLAGRWFAGGRVRLHRDRIDLLASPVGDVSRLSQLVPGSPISDGSQKRPKHLLEKTRTLYARHGCSECLGRFRSGNDGGFCGRLSKSTVVRIRDVAIGKKLVVVLVGIVETVPASSTDGVNWKERVKPRRIRATAMTIQYGVRGMILTAQSEAFNKEWNSGDDQLRLRWMIYLMVLADAAESVRDTIRFEYCLASSSGWTKSPVLWTEIGESSLTGPELVLDTTDKVVLIKEKLKAARDRQKSYTDNRRKLLEFEVGDRVMLKVSSWKGVVHFGKKDEIKVDKTLLFVEEPVEIIYREVKSLKRSRILLVKVRWNSKGGPEFTW
ncbi:hypothetical protein Tco_0518174 [Tanacetum coccineum]